MTDSTGNIVGEQRYYPFGETRLSTGTLYTDKLFTGQRNMAGLGIYHYQSRFYSPKLGRFLSADSLVPNPFNPQDYSRYSYVRNNPVRYIDPSGHRVCVTQEECADMGTTPNGGRNLPKPKKMPGGGNDRDRGGDDAIPDPNPNGLPAPVIGPSLGGGGSNIPELSKDDNALDDGLEQTDGGSSPSVTQTVPDPRKMVEGMALLTILFFFVDLPIVIGLIALFPELEIGMLVTEVWVYPLALAIIDAHIYAANLIIEGNTGVKDYYNYLLIPKIPWEELKK